VLPGWNTANVLAQSGGYSGAFQRMGFGPRGMAMGNAMSSVIREGSFGYYNPAHAAILTENRQIDLSKAVMAFDRTLNMVNVHFNIPPNAGIGTYLLHAGVYEIDGRSSSGYHTGMISTHEYQLGTQFALRFNEKFWGGIGFKFNLARYHKELDNSNSFGIDLGMQAQLSESIAAGAVIKDLLASYKWNTADFYGDDFNMASDHHFPVRIKIGISVILPVSVLLSAEFEKRLNNPDTVFNRINSSFLRFGGSYQIHERFTVRSGIRLYELASDPGSAISAGFSIHLPFDRFSPSIDYAFAEETNRVANLHVFALRLHI
jgi:hypothetical protein